MESHPLEQMLIPDPIPWDCLERRNCGCLPHEVGVASFQQSHRWSNGTGMCGQSGMPVNQAPLSFLRQWNVCWVNFQHQSLGECEECVWGVEVGFPSLAVRVSTHTFTGHRRRAVRDKRS